jgi:hypothetical protein
MRVTEDTSAVGLPRYPSGLNHFLHMIMMLRNPVMPSVPGGDASAMLS